MSHLQSIIEKCHLANPKLLELTPGCVVKKKDLLCKIVALRHDEDFDEYIFTKGIHPTKKYLHDNIFIQRIYPEDVILGHPITLQDILLATKEPMAIDRKGFLYYLENDEWVSDGEKYDLTKSPYDQEESVLEFISKNI